MKRYHIAGRTLPWEELNPQGQWLKRDEVIAALAEKDIHVHELSDVLEALGIEQEEYDEALESAEHERKHREDPEPAEYRGDR